MIRTETQDQISDEIKHGTSRAFFVYGRKISATGADRGFKR